METEPRRFGYGASSYTPMQPTPGEFSIGRASLSHPHRTVTGETINRNFTTNRITLLVSIPCMVAKTVRTCLCNKNFTNQQAFQIIIKNVYSLMTGIIIN